MGYLHGSDCRGVERVSGTGAISIGGLGTFSFVDTLDFFTNQTLQFAGIADLGLSGESILDTMNGAFATYNDVSSIGPLSGPVFYSSGYTFMTSGGTLNFTSAGGTSTLAAAVTPEPDSVVLLGTGLVGLLAAMSRRLRRA